MKTRLASVGLCVVFAILTLTTSTGESASVTITSADFNFAFGVTVVGATNTNAWTSEGNPNSPTTQGDFTFSPAPTGRTWSNTGPTFLNGVLGSGDHTNVSGWIGSGPPNFSVPIMASYDGSAPINASATPNYQLRLEITNISIYGARDAGGTSTLSIMAWDEVTPGHLQTSPAINLMTMPVGGLGNPVNYTQLLWNPNDYDVSLASLNDSFSRIFDILPGNANDWRVIDGLEISGRVHLIYDAVEIPEPSGMLLAGMAALGLGTVVARGKKRGKQK